MTKLSLGDFAINQATQENASGKALTLEDFKNAEENKLLDEEEIKKNPSINNAIAIQKNEDGSLKYTFDNI